MASRHVVSLGCRRFRRTLGRVGLEHHEVCGAKASETRRSRTHFLGDEHESISGAQIPQYRHADVFRQEDENDLRRREFAHRDELDAAVSLQKLTSSSNI